MKRLTAATLAAATAMSLAAAPAQADEALERAKFLGILAVKGTGAAPDTEPVGKMVVGSIKAGSSAEEAYNATQAGWIITWIAVAATGLGALAFGAKQVGLLKF
ncbi:hypothetical protein KBX29_08715 [Corynebacterium sp. CCUG 18816]|uniref:hypothetical protein n=1 Tax=Corynebacterium pseudogenitalium TaxID=38303 RepID=UPI0021088311|nr:hypothetical protein [Corynebacterium pseudogenitalium]MCQ4616905.1 hypothetical protein [Corynebacterium pseudogenitalium]